MRDTVSRASFVKSHERMRGSSRRLEAPTYVFAEMRYVARPRHWPIDVRRIFLSLSWVRLQLSVRDPDLLHRRFSGNILSSVHPSICFFLFPLFSLLWHRYITVFLRVIVLAPCRAMPTLLDDVRGFRLSRRSSPFGNPRPVQSLVNFLFDDPLRSTPKSQRVPSRRTKQFRGEGISCLLLRPVFWHATNNAIVYSIVIFHKRVNATIDPSIRMYGAIQQYDRTQENTSLILDLNGQNVVGSLDSVIPASFGPTEIHHRSWAVCVAVWLARVA